MSGEWIYTGTLMASDLTTFLLCYYFFDGLLERRPLKKMWNRILFTVMIVMLLISAFYVKAPLEVVLRAIAFYSFIVIVFFKTGLLVRLTAGLFFLVFGMLAEIITGLFLASYLQVPLSDFQENTTLFVIGVIVSRLMMLIFVKIGIKLFGKKRRILALGWWGLIMTMPLVSIMISIHVLFQSIALETYDFGSFASAIGILYINILAFWLFDGMMSRLEENHIMRFENQQLVLQEKHYQEIIEGHRQTRGLWHDMNHYLLAIYTHLDGKDLEAAKSDVERIQWALKDAGKAVITGNQVMDAIIAHKMTEIEGDAIEFRLDVQVPDRLSIANMDLSIVLGNALDNAITACRKTSASGTSAIELSAFIQQDALVLSVSNPVEMGAIKQKEGRFLTTKSDEQWMHGFGLKNMEKAVMRYGGHMKTTLEAQRFYLDVVLPLE